jgi:hypothetical protein
MNYVRREGKLHSLLIESLHVAIFAKATMMQNKPHQKTGETKGRSYGQFNFVQFVHDQQPGTTQFQPHSRIYTYR